MLSIVRLNGYLPGHRLREEDLVQVGARTEVGLVRRRNEDSLLVDEQQRVFAVADGLGGHPAGHLASRLAVDTIASTLTGKPLQEMDDVGSVLSETLQAAHQAVLEGAEADPSRRGMGTTAVLAHMSRNERELWIGHVGDSRAYLMRSGELRQVTTDHTSGGWLGGRTISQALGTWGDVSPEVIHHELQPGDRILLCTDGLTDMVHAPQIARLLGADEHAERLCDQLVDEAIAEGGRDNVTVVVVTVED
ncbi:MAG: protein phosphatase 2C domain-containing protein [Actinomycetota bacterium]|nr:protein phosphatase 2C domain-containing protein [Actinomycetota bacterium]